eukprot:CAMPEP_0183293466 /NCGR_PEP_ID=MMETSP0160_2-20130417/2140_1 /TAXON_ID=2839 ORGANISM="Odontella Sinensis, Strain Grunow 1884" /NCGR_SAMPLE_ID=MMETSP0160_2 /ASSEMBLY_ACC=CAM_ASM_000250 /LENGTH=160 /DNA_ID=CAMNT_0025454587 /DNA_START=88 /DNA_END=570 /DNA_ORIENTATION=+
MRIYALLLLVSKVALLPNVLADGGLRGSFDDAIAEMRELKKKKNGSKGDKNTRSKKVKEDDEPGSTGGVGNRFANAEGTGWIRSYDAKADKGREFPPNDTLCTDTSECIDGCCFNQFGLKKYDDRYDGYFFCHSTDLDENILAKGCLESTSQAIPISGLV